MAAAVATHTTERCGDSAVPMRPPVGRKPFEPVVELIKLLHQFLSAAAVRVCSHPAPKDLPVHPGRECLRSCRADEGEWWNLRPSASPVPKVGRGREPIPAQVARGALAYAIDVLRTLDRHAAEELPPVLRSQVAELRPGQPVLDLEATAYDSGPCTPYGGQLPPPCSSLLGTRRIVITRTDAGTSSHDPLHPSNRPAVTPGVRRPFAPRTAGAGSTS
jgi:hypothetical protein